VDKRRARNRSLLRDGAVLLLLVLVLGLAWTVRETPNADLPPARDLTGRMDDVFRLARSGQLDIGTTPRVVAPGIQGGLFERRTRSDRWVLTGESGSDCYVLWWDDEGVRRTRVLSSALPCEPSTGTMAPGSFERLGRAVDEAAPTAAWTDVLPEAVQLRAWFLPVLIVGGGLALAALVRMIIALMVGDAPSTVRR
jgi:hypothetical protein